MTLHSQSSPRRNDGISHERPLFNSEQIHSQTLTCTLSSEKGSCIFVWFQMPLVFTNAFSVLSYLTRPVYVEARKAPNTPQYQTESHFALQANRRQLSLPPASLPGEVTALLRWQLLLSYCWQPPRPQPASALRLSPFPRRRWAALLACAPPTPARRATASQRSARDLIGGAAPARCRASSCARGCHGWHGAAPAARGRRGGGGHQPRAPWLRPPGQEERLGGGRHLPASRRPPRVRVGAPSLAPPQPLGPRRRRRGEPGGPAAPFPALRRPCLSLPAGRAWRSARRGRRWRRRRCACATCASPPSSTRRAPPRATITSPSWWRARRSRGRSRATASPRRTRVRGRAGPGGGSGACFLRCSAQRAPGAARLRGLCQNLHVRGRFSLIGVIFACIAAQWRNEARAWLQVTSVPQVEKTRISGGVKASRRESHNVRQRISVCVDCDYSTVCADLAGAELLHDWFYTLVPFLFSPRRLGMGEVGWIPSGRSAVLGLTLLKRARLQSLHGGARSSEGVHGKSPTGVKKFTVVMEQAEGQTCFCWCGKGCVILTLPTWKLYLPKARTKPNVSVLLLDFADQLSLVAELFSSSSI